LEFFVHFISDAVVLCERVGAEVPAGVTLAQVSELRQVTSNAFAEQRRCLMFRDRCINKPLPFEAMRPFLNEISVTTRDQLTAFRDLGNIAEMLEKLLPVVTPPEPERNFDRRKLFTRFFKPGTE